MKIVAVIDSLAMGGAEKVVSLLTREWYSKQHEVIVALFNTTNRAFEYGGRIVDLSLYTNRSNWRRLRRLWVGSTRLAKLFVRERPDRIIAFMESANFPCIVAAYLTGLLHCLCVSVHTDPSMIPFPYRLLIPWFYRFPSRVVGVSRGITRTLEEMGIPAKKLVSIPNPLVVKQHTNHQGRPRPYAARYMLGVGRLMKEKGFDHLLMAFSRVPFTDLHLVILGEGDECGALSDLSQRLGIASRVFLPGFRKDVGTWYRYAECFVLSSRYEGWGNVLMEAMAAGCPVVSFDCRYGPAEILENGKCGLLVEQGNVDALAAAIARLLSCDALRNGFKIASGRRVMEFAVDLVAPQWL